jgi:hypothetical protein
MSSKNKIIEKINEVVKPYCAREWCILKEFCISKQINVRVLIQLKCIEHRKFELSEKVGRDVGWKVAYTEWIDSGCAELFSKYYNEDLTAEQIYLKVVKKIPIRE